MGKAKEAVKIIQLNIDIVSGKVYIPAKKLSTALNIPEEQYEVPLEWLRYCLQKNGFEFSTSFTRKGKKLLKFAKENKTYVFGIVQGNITVEVY